MTEKEITEKSYREYVREWSAFTEKLRRLMEENPSFLVSIAGRVDYKDCEVMRIVDPSNDAIVADGIMIMVSFKEPEEPGYDRDFFH